MARNAKTLSDVVREQREGGPSPANIFIGVAVIAQRDRRRAGRFWPAGETKLTAEDVAALGEAGMTAIDDDPVLRIVPLAPSQEGDDE